MNVDWFLHCFGFNLMKLRPKILPETCKQQLILLTKKMNHPQIFIEFNIMDETTEYKIYILINKIEKTCA